MKDAAIQLVNFLLNPIYLPLILFTIAYWKSDILKMARGYNGVFQLFEVTKLSCVYLMYGYLAEVIYHNREFDIWFGIFVLTLLIVPEKELKELIRAIIKKTLGKIEAPNTTIKNDVKDEEKSM